LIGEEIQVAMSVDNRRCLCDVESYRLVLLMEIKMNNLDAGPKFYQHKLEEQLFPAACKSGSEEKVDLRFQIPSTLSSKAVD